MNKLTDYLEYIYEGLSVKTQRFEKASIVKICDIGIVIKTEDRKYYTYTNSILYMIEITDINFINNIRLEKLKRILEC